MRCASRLLPCAAIWASLAVSSAAARAEDNRDAAKVPESGSPSAKSIDAPSTASQSPSNSETAASDAPPRSEAAAEVAYQQAQAKYAKNDLAGALESMRESYRLCQRPELLYNLAMLEHELHECSAALTDYTSYLQQVPQGRYRQAAEQASAELGRECKVVAVAPPSNAVPAPPLVTKVESPSGRERGSPQVARADAGYWSPSRVVGWSAVTAGALAGAGALYFTVAALTARSDYQHSIDAAYVGNGSYDPSLQDKQHRDQTSAQVLAVSGGALVAGGVLVLLFGAEHSAHATAEVQALPGLVAASYSQRF